MTSVSINREASDKTKGFRLQKVRAIELMLKSINKDTDSVFYTAIENVEDVSHWHVEDNSQKNYYEEDKNYAADGSQYNYSYGVCKEGLNVVCVHV